MGQGATQAPPDPSMNELVKGLHQTAYLNAKLKELLSEKKPPTKKDVFDMASDLVDHGVLTPQRIAGELATMPPSEDMLKPWLFTHWLVTENHMEQLSQMIQAKSAQPQPGQSQPQAQGMPGQIPAMQPGAPQPSQSPQPPQNMLMPNGGGQ